MNDIHPHITVVVGPMSCFFGNANRAMGLRTHHHHAEVWLTYRAAQGHHGYPSFLATNDALRERLKELCATIFTDATNEDVAARLLAEFRVYTHPSWHKYGGRYALETVELDVYSTDDAIGHDNGVTRYTANLGDGEMVWLAPDPDRDGEFTIDLWPIRSDPKPQATQFAYTGGGGGGCGGARPHGTLIFDPPTDRIMGVDMETIRDAAGDVVREEPRDHSLADERLTELARRAERKRLEDQVTDAQRALRDAQLSARAELDKATRELKEFLQ
ncbi:hypothetical protein [Gordonia asplenii]|uniref:hypothetical protein n=1 Tax=Gordonia asplenii TaxID=2725283 RepID=UPI001B7D6DA8|nr:hypothetical protein [Gordonia asplenii]